MGNIFGAVDSIKDLKDLKIDVNLKLNSLILFYLYECFAYSYVCMSCVCLVF